MKLGKGVKVYSGKEVFIKEIPDIKAEKLGLKTVKKEAPKVTDK